MKIRSIFAILVFAGVLFHLFGQDKNKDFKVVQFADKKMTDNPISLAVDTKGRVYVAEVGRFHKGVEDTRRHNYWFLDEIRIHSLEDRTALYDKWIKLGKFKKGHFASGEDRIAVLFDTNDDGKADKRKIYAGKFNHPLDGNGSSILLGPDGTMYYANIPHIWKITDKDGDGISEKREAMITGFGLRLGVNGHDLHGLEWGVDGRLYFSNGDRGYNLKTKEGKLLKDSERGAVIRCDPDGSNLEIYTIGNRNPQDLAFDQFGNMFTVDNNRGRGDRSRVCYLVEGGDYGWNSGHENKTTFFHASRLRFRKGPRYQDGWRVEGDWKTKFDGQSAYCIPSLDYIDGGSCGITFNPGRSMGRKYDNHFFYSGYKHGLFTFKFVPDKGGLKIVNKDVFWKQGLVIDSEFDHRGRLFVADYVATFNAPKGETKGGIYMITYPEGLKEKSVVSAAAILKGGFSKLASADLYNNLFHADMRVRMFSQFELAKRKEKDLFLKALGTKDQLARLHSIWGLGQLSRKDKSYNKVIVPFLKDADWRVRAQAVKVLGESNDPAVFEDIAKLMKDENMRVQN